MATDGWHEEDVLGGKGDYERTMGHTNEGESSTLALFGWFNTRK